MPDIKKELLDKNMKIRKVTPEYQDKTSALLRSAFPKSLHETQLVEKFHNNGTPLHEWVCIHINKVIGYIAFSNAYKDNEIYGLHLAPMAVAPQFHRQGIGSELIKFALRQDPIKTSTIFVLGNPEFYKRFGFEPCSIPICPFDNKNKHFMAIRNATKTTFTIGYEAEFDTQSVVYKAKKSRSKRKK